MQIKKYRTAAGSTVEVFGEHMRNYEISFDWVEEPGACCDCKPYYDFESNRLRWSCHSHESGSAELMEVPRK